MVVLCSSLLQQPILCGKRVVSADKPGAVTVFSGLSCACTLKLLCLLIKCQRVLRSKPECIKSAAKMQFAFRPVTLQLFSIKQMMNGV